jgi:hypothetical protein
LPTILAKHGPRQSSVEKAILETKLRLWIATTRIKKDFGIGGTFNSFKIFVEVTEHLKSLKKVYVRAPLFIELDLSISYVFLVGGGRGS